MNTAVPSNGPGGENSAWLLSRALTGSSAYYSIGNTTLSGAGTYTLSLYAKAATHGDHIGMRMITSYPSRIDAVVNLTNGSITGIFTSSGWVSNGGRVTPVGDGWYRCELTGTYSGSNSIGVICGPTDGVSIAGWEGANSVASNCYFYGIQLELGGFATSYIPTVSSAVTRAADIANVTGSDFDSWYNQEEGTFVMKFKCSSNFTGPVGLMPNASALCAAHSSPGVISDMWGSTVSVSGPNMKTDIATAARSYCFRDSYAAIACGGNVAVQNPPLNRFNATGIRIGARPVGSWVINGPISYIRYWPRRLPNNQLELLTK